MISHKDCIRSQTLKLKYNSFIGRDREPPYPNPVFKLLVLIVNKKGDNFISLFTKTL